MMMAGHQMMNGVLNGGDWRIGRSRPQQLLYMLESGVLSDCAFRVGNPGVPSKFKEFQLHRQTLAQASPVWERMLLPGPGEPHMSEADTGIVHIMDIQPHIFHIVLRHLYGDEGALRSLDYEEVGEVTVVADRYQVPDLLAACEDRVNQLGRMVDRHSVWRALRLAELLPGADSLREACARVLRRRTVFCLKAPCFLQSSPWAVELLLSQKALCTDEFTVVRAVMAWTDKKVHQGLAENRRAALTPHLLPLLRLSVLTQYQLHFLKLTSSVLTKEEKQALLAKNVTKFPPTLSREKARRLLSKNLEATPRRALRRSIRPPRQGV